MKKVILLFLVSLATIFNSSAQFDDRFYFPSKEWKKIQGIEFIAFNFCIEQDTLNTLLFKPEKKVKATILFYHGSGGNISTYMSLLKPLVNSGYQVFAVDFRGYGKSTGKPTHLNIANDAQFIFDKMIVKEEFKGLPVIIYGASMGTQIATKIAKDNQEKISALILDGTISSFTDMALLSVPEEQKPMITQYVTSPYSAKEDIKEIKNIPKLFIHSKEDVSVPFCQGELVYNNATGQKELWIYKGEHLEAAVKYPELLIQKIKDLTYTNSTITDYGKKNSLEITIHGLRNDQGKIVLILEELSGKKVASISQRIKNNQCHIAIDNIEDGKYSVYYFHDENDNNELDSKLGIPKEGYGFSNNAKGSFGPPPIEERSMVISSNKFIELKPEYLSF